MNITPKTLIQSIGKYYLIGSDFVVNVHPKLFSGLHSRNILPKFLHSVAAGDSVDVRVTKYEKNRTTN